MHIFLYFAARHCGHGFYEVHGEFQFYQGGKIKRAEHSDSIDHCRNLCNEAPECCSFEWSDIRDKCNINFKCHPNTEKKVDYVFCTTGKGNGK